MAKEPISEERLDALRTMNLDAILPQAAKWSLATREQANRLLAMVAPVFVELLDEIDALDEELEFTDSELDTALARLKRLRPTVPATDAVISAVRRERYDGRRWRVLWREDGRRRSATFYRPSQARGLYEDLQDRQYRDGVR